MEGTSYRRADGRWEWKITLPDGQRRSFYGSTERAAREKRNQAIRDYEAGLARDNERITVNQYLDRWLQETASVRVKPSTLAAYTSHVEVHIKPAMQRIRLRDLKPDHVNRMLDAMVRSGVAPATANRVRATLRTALTSAMKQRDVTYNAAALSEARRERKNRVRPLTVPEAVILIEGTRGNPMGPLIEVAIYTGLRQGELLALAWQDIDFDLETLTVRRTLTWVKNPHADTPRNMPMFTDPKTETSRRTIHIPTPAIEALKRQRQLVIELQEAATVTRWRPLPGEHLVFPTTVGSPQNSSNVTNRLKRILEDLDLPHQRFHDLRHLTASLMLAEGLDIFTVKEILGHSQIAQTANTYGHLTQKLSETAALRLGTSIFDDAGDDKTETLTTYPTTDAMASDDTEEGL